MTINVFFINIIIQNFICNNKISYYRYIKWSNNQYNTKMYKKNYKKYNSKIEMKANSIRNNHSKYTLSRYASWKASISRVDT